MSEMYAISRLAKYKYSDVGGVLKEALRILPNYNNPDCDPSKSHLNIALVECDLHGLSPEKYILKYREDNNIKGRFNTSAPNPKNVTNCMCQCLFTASSEWFERLTEDERITYFKDCLDFFKSEFPSAEIISAIIHRDETTEHMHVTFLPTVERVNKKTGEIETIFSTSKLMPGKEFFPQYQDRFYKFITEKYDGFTRGKSDRKNLSVKDYKELMYLKNTCNDLYAQLDECKSTIDSQFKKINQLNDELREYISFKPYKTLLERIPLIGVFFEVLRELKTETRISILKECIELAKREVNKDIEEKKDISLSAKIISAEKRQIIDRLFGNKNQYLKNKDMEISDNF